VGQQLRLRLRHVHEEVDRLDPGTEQVRSLRGRVVLDDELTLRRVNNQLALDWQVGLELMGETEAGTEPLHVDSHDTDRQHVHAATLRQATIDSRIYTTRA